jgi:hypothetical protein
MSIKPAHDLLHLLLGQDTSCELAWVIVYPVFKYILSSILELYIRPESIWLLGAGFANPAPRALAQGDRARLEVDSL